MGDVPIATRVARWREHWRYTKSRLAREAGLHLSSLWRIEAGEQEARASEIESIAAALGMSVSEFYGPLPPRERDRRAAK